jgi:uncharacterized RDD family membrane protein YckC
MTSVNDYVRQVLDELPSATPARDQIAMELRASIQERIDRGESLDTVIAQLGDPRTLAESYLSALPLESATFGSRVAAKLIDALIFFVGTMLLACVAFFSAPPEIAPFFVLGVIVLGSFGFAAYTVLAESHSGQTLGKRFMHIRAVRESGARISLGQGVVRQLPMFFEVFALDALFALFTEKHQRAFELLSKTRVVRSPQMAAAR